MFFVFECHCISFLSLLKLAFFNSIYSRCSIKIFPTILSFLSMKRIDSSVVFWVSYSLPKVNLMPKWCFHTSITSSQITFAAVFLQQPSLNSVTNLARTSQFFGNFETFKVDRELPRRYNCVRGFTWIRERGVGGGGEGREWITELGRRSVISAIMSLSRNSYYPLHITGLVFWHLNLYVRN